MNYDDWFELYGDDAQATARLMGTTDCHMDATIEQLYIMFNELQKGKFSFNDKVTYGNLPNPQADE